MTTELQYQDKEQNLFKKDDYSEVDYEYQSEPSGFFAKMTKFLNAETKGVERITDEEKTDDDLANTATMWWAANMVASAYALGALGSPVFGLNFMQATLTIFFFAFIGAVPVAFFSVFGVEFGLRQMILSRYLAGNVTARVFGCLNVVAQVGWCSVNTMVSAQLLHIINPGGHQCPPWAGCLVIIACTVAVTFFGYRVIHTFEKWSWIPTFIIFIIMIARIAKSGNFTNTPLKGGPTIAGGVLSFGSAIFGYSAGWATYAADYTVYMPRNTNKTKVFFAVLLGMFLPLVFALLMGAASVTGIYKDAEWKALYNEHSIGGLVFAILAGKHALGGFGQFCCVVLAMSTVANNVPNMYSIALSTQSLWAGFSSVPRPFWTLIGNIAALAISISAYYKFEAFITNFMNVVGYYCAMYLAICFSEHYFYRKTFANYNPQEWNNWKALPIGYAGMFAFCVGVAGVVIGMDQDWYDGPIGRLIGKNGGDIGFELAGAFSFIAFNATRWLEIKYIGR